MLLLREAQFFDDGDPVLFALHPLPGKGYGVCQNSVYGFLFSPLPEIQGTLLLREPVVTPAISITLF